jgi:hypothetical protein
MAKLVRIANRHDPIAGLQRIGIAEPCDRKIGWTADEPDDSRVRRGVAADNGRPIRGRLVPEQPDFDDFRVGDYMIVGENVAVGADEKA